jgi:hypothetical protein
MEAKPPIALSDFGMEAIVFNPKREGNNEPVVVTVTVETIVLCETVVVETITVVVEGGRVLVTVVREPATLVVIVVVLAGSVDVLVENMITVVGVVVVVCEWSEPVAKKKRRHCKIDSHVPKILGKRCPLKTIKVARCDIPAG